MKGRRRGCEGRREGLAVKREEGVKDRGSEKGKKLRRNGSKNRRGGRCLGEKKQGVKKGAVKRKRVKPGITQQQEQYSGMDSVEKTIETPVQSVPPRQRHGWCGVWQILVTITLPHTHTYKYFICSISSHSLHTFLLFSL